jgi:hypothetical protein
MTAKTHTLFCEDKEKSAFMLVLSNGNPALLNGHLWFFDPYLGERLFRIANKQIKSKGLQIKDVPIDTSNIKGNLLDALKKDKKNIVVGNNEAFNELIDYIVRGGKQKQAPKTSVNVDHQEPWDTEKLSDFKKSSSNVPRDRYDIIAAKNKQHRMTNWESKHRELEARVRRLEKLILDE